MHASIIQVENRLRSRLATQAINDPDFSVLLRAGSDSIQQAARSASNEATIEAAFERHLFTILRAIGIEYFPDKERGVKGIPNRQRGDSRSRVREAVAAYSSTIGAGAHGTVLRLSGRTDSRFRDVVIEFKHRSQMALTSQVIQHIGQLKGYLEAIGTESNGDQIGFLTDGLKYIRIVRGADGIFQTSSLAPVDADGLAVICRALVASKRSALKAENLVEDFCGDVETGHLFVAARAVLASLRKSSITKTQMLFSEWESLFRLAHEDTSQQKRIEARREALEKVFKCQISGSSFEYMCLFSLHTAYAIVAKLIAYKVVSDTLFQTSLQDYKSLLEADDSSVQVFCAALEDGDLFRQVGFLNLLEGDFFSWYADPQQWDHAIAESVRDILNVLARYEDAQNIFVANKAIDLFRHLYEAAIPQIVRASFGEFYTPLWLAQHVLETSGFTVGDRVLDPCCGSGTFLIAALQEIRDAYRDRPKDTTLRAMLDSVVGIDLNPLAVLTSRIHYFIYISDLLDRGQEDIVIPVFLGDASNVPRVIGRGRAAQVRYTLRTLRTPLEISIPMSFITDAQALFTTMNEFEGLLSQGAYDGACAVFDRYCDDNGLNDRERRSLRELADQISELERRQWNGIWARIIANFASTVAIGRFDRIIGNPPWIDWKSLPEVYRGTIKQLCIDRGLFSGDKRTGGINLNICALIAHVSATNWLTDNGTLAFLMPRELAVQPSYEGWRSSVGGADCRIAAFHDWSKAGHPFEPVREDFMTFVLQRGSNRSSAVSCTEYTKRERGSRPWLWNSLKEARGELLATERLARAIIPGKSAFSFADTAGELNEFALIAGESEYIGREGIEFYPQELLMFRYLRPGPRQGTIFVENFQGRKSKYKIPKQTILLETKYLFPLVKGPFIGRFEYEENDLLVAFPYEPDDPHRPLSRTALRAESPLLLNYFLKYESQLAAQTAYSDSIRAAGEFYGLARTGPYSFARAYVAFRDNTKWAACVISSKRMPWGERKRYLFQNHAVSMCESRDRRFITLDEAHYVASILNADVVSRFILATSDERSFKIRPPIHIPRYDSRDQRHLDLASLSREAHRDPHSRDVAVRQASSIYLRICRKRVA